jgi:hypothetical protein
MYFPCPTGIRVCPQMCRARGCYRKCKAYQERTRLPKDMAAWCRLVSLCADRDGEVLRMEDTRGALSPGEEAR